LTPFVAGGWPAIRPACRGRAKGDGRVLSQAQEQAIQSLIIQNRSEPLKMDFCLRVHHSKLVKAWVAEHG